MSNGFEALIGRRVVDVTDDRLVLDDGTELEFTEVQDCCASADFGLFGYDMTDPPIIAAIGDDEAEVEGDGGEHYNVRTITLLGINGQIGEIEATANDGNGGYYFSGLTLVVRYPDGTHSGSEVVVSA